MRREAAISTSIGYSTSAQKADVVAAYTLKADGRRIDVPKDNYQVAIHRGKGKDSPVHSDRSSLTVVFPDVSVGDSVVFSYRVTQSEPMFPNQDSNAMVFYNQIAHDDVRVRVDYPVTLALKYEARGMKEAQNVVKNGRRVVEWRYANPTPIKTKRRDFSVLDPDKEAGLSIA